MTCALAMLGCTGEIGDTRSTARETEPPPIETSLADTVAALGVRRLSTVEYDNTVRDLLGDDSRPSGTYLPPDARLPFDNDVDSQVPSRALVEGAELLANDVAARFVADAERRERIVGCVPSGPDDAACLHEFITAFGRRALRRPLGPAEVDRWLTFSEFAIEDGDFYAAVEAVVQGMLQELAFLYRVEVGVPVPGAPGVFALDDFEIATRLSYLVWASAPDDALLDRAQAGELAGAEGRRAAVRAMLEDPRAIENVERFHALWLGYDLIAGGALGSAMRSESDALVRRVVFDDALPWQEIFRFPQSYLTPELAAHYGIERPAEAGWVRYADERRGIFSHATFLSNGGELEETLPIHRGLLVRTQILCDPIGDPPPGAGVLGEPTEGESTCKSARLERHREGTCAFCHEQVDPIGFGLDGYDQLGRFRTAEPERPECEIEGTGAIDGVPFRGPGGLGEVLAGSPELGRCAIQQVYRFAMGHTSLTSEDVAFIAALEERVRPEEFRFDELLVELAASDAFRYRREREE